RDVLRRHRELQQVALTVELLDVLDRDPLGTGALLAHRLRPEVGAAEDGVRVQYVDANAGFAVLDRQYAGELRFCRLRRAVGAEILARRRHVLRRYEDDAAAQPLPPQQ